jgi:hypothetical protein
VRQVATGAQTTQQPVEKTFRRVNKRRTKAAALSENLVGKFWRLRENGL